MRNVTSFHYLHVLLNFNTWCLVCCSIDSGKMVTETAKPVPSPSTSSSTSSEYERVMLEAQAALKVLQKAQAEVKKRSAAASLLTRDLRDTEDKADRISKELDSDLSSSVVNNILKEAKSDPSDDVDVSSITEEGSTDLAALREDVRGLEKIYTDSKKLLSTSNVGECFRSCVADEIPLSLPVFPSLSDQRPDVSLKVLSSSSALQAQGHVDVEFSIVGEMT
jgi:hypothetical protein